MAKKHCIPERGLSKRFYSEFRAWQHMRERCQKRSDPRWHDYGGRGIQVCQRWQKSFHNFLTDMGPKPSPLHSLDRIDNNGHYCPENCRWATKKQQSRNMRTNHMLTYQGRCQCLPDWAEEVGIDLSMLQARLRRGWTIFEALTTPSWGRNKNAIMITMNGKTQSIRQWSKEFKIRYNTVLRRIWQGWTPESAITTRSQKAPKT